MRYLILVKKNNGWQSLNPYFINFSKLQKQLTGMKEERIVVNVDKGRVKGIGYSEGEK